LLWIRQDRPPFFIADGEQNRRSNMGSQTPLHSCHVEAGARIVDFGGWDMPLHYGSQLEEHHAVRKQAGAFDVSHMTLKDPGKALYSCMLNTDGGVVDDLITYYLEPGRYRMVVNAATRDKDLLWINEQAAPYAVEVNERPELAMIAVQGPQARTIAANILDEQFREAALALSPFYALEAGETFIARTGYTGEDGWEIVMPADKAPDFWRQCVDAGIQPCGLGARDTLRLEAGMNLYGTDMDEATSPLEAGLGWTIAWDPEDRDFIGRVPLTEMRSNPERRRFAGLLLEDKGVLRNHQLVIVEGRDDGEITSGGFSPTLERSIAMARVPAGEYERAQVKVRNRLLDVRVVGLPFVRHGNIRIDL
jgi:aminomethyltransferase